MMPAPRADGGSLATANIPFAAIAIAVIALGALLVLAWALVHHPVPQEVVPDGPWSICGTPIAMPIEVGDAEIMMPDGALTFLIRDGQGKLSMIQFAWSSEHAAFERLLFYPIPPLGLSRWPDPMPVEDAHEREMMRSLVFHSMVHHHFHGSAHEHGLAYQLYPSRYDQLVAWLQDRH